MRTRSSATHALHASVLKSTQRVRDAVSSLVRRSAVVEPLEDRTLFATKIMPLGDSITASETGHASYRYWLWKNLQAGGYQNLDFVGSQSGVSNGSPLYTDFDQNNEGHWGWRADEVAAQMTSWANTYRPDVVLIHLGTNDLAQNQSVSSTITDLGLIIDRVRAVVPNAVFLLAKIIPNNTNPSQVQQLNTSIGTLATQKNTSSSRVISVDQWSGFSTSSDLYDTYHPDESGEQKMANKWYSALQGVLSTSPPPTLPPPPAGTYLSDLSPTFTSNGWGSYEKDKSNGESNAGDGGIITLQGTGYSKGLGVHAASELRYNLAGQYSSFQADIGVDDEVGNNGQVIFQVWDNLGNKLYDSAAMTGSTATKSINVNVTGKTELRLIVTDGGNGNAADHADWAWARLQKAATPTGPVVAAISGATISENGTYTASGSFSDAGAGPWSGIVNYGDGTGNLPLTLASNKTFNLSHQYLDNGNYTVTVTVTGGALNGSGTAAVSVGNVAPTVTMPPNGNVNYGSVWSGSGSFTDPGTLDTFTATVDYGDGSAVAPLALKANKTFDLSKTYFSGGTFTITVTITDKDGGKTTKTNTVTVVGAPIPQTTYLSDLTPTLSTNGWGPIEKDKSNGESNANDGVAIKIGTTTYAKGLGTHAASELRYALNKQYGRFQAFVGVDAEVGNNGSVQFLVYGDGALLFDSAVVRGGQAAKAVDVSVANVTELRLVINNGGDGADYDHADWGDAKLTKAAPAGLTVNSFAGATINEGSTYTALGSFSDPGVGPWTATVDYGDGTGPVALALNADKTFNLSHTYADNGTYAVTVVVNNGSSNAQSVASVKSNNVIPTLTVAASANGTPTFAQSGSFADPGADTWTATVDYGDGTGAHALAVNAATKTFNLNNVYTYNGAYDVKVTVVDDDGGSATSTTKVNVTGGLARPEVYVSDLATISATNGWGTFEKDKSNGESLTGDGGTIMIAGKTYTKGLGVHASSDIRYDLTGGGYQTFESDFGVDDEELGAGSVRFQVWLDGVMVWDSGVVRGGQAAQHISLNVASKSQLRLVVTDAGDGADSDHGDWANAKLTR